MGRQHNLSCCIPELDKSALVCNWHSEMFSHHFPKILQWNCNNNTIIREYCYITYRESNVTLRCYNLPPCIHCQSKTLQLQHIGGLGSDPTCYTAPSSSYLQVRFCLNEIAVYVYIQQCYKCRMAGKYIQYEHCIAKQSLRLQEGHLYPE